MQLKTAATVADTVANEAHTVSENVDAAATGNATTQTAADAGANVTDAGAKVTNTAATFSLTAATQALGKAIKANPIGLIATAIIAVIPLVVKLADALITTSEEIQEAGAKAREEIDSLNDALDNIKTTTKDVRLEYAKLAQGVNQLNGQNLSLSTEDYEQFLDLSNQLAELFPQLVKGYNDNGDAILDLSGDVNTIVSSLNNLVEVEKQLTFSQINEQMDDVFNAFAANAESYIEKIDKTKKAIASISDFNFNDIFEETHDQTGLTSGNQYVVRLKIDDSDIGVKLKDAFGDKLYTSGNVPGIDDLWDFRFEAKDFDNNVAELKRYISNTLRDLNNELNANKNDLAQEWSGLYGTIINNILPQDEGYANASKEVQNAINSVVNGIDISEWIDDGATWDDFKDKIQENIVNVLLSGDTPIKVSNALSELFNNPDLDIDTSIQYLDSIIAYYEERGIEVPVVFTEKKDAAQDVLNRFNEHNANLVVYGKNGNYADLNNTFSKYGIDTEAEYEYWLTVTKGAKNAEQAIRMYEDSIKDVSEVQKYTKSEMIDAINEMTDGFDVLGDIYEDVRDGAEFDFTKLDSKKFSESFEGLEDEYTAFIEKVSESPGVITKEVQYAFNDLVTAYVNHSGILDEVTDETKDLTVAMLKNMGVANAEEEVSNVLAIKKAKERYETEELVDATSDEIKAHYDNANASEVERIALAQLYFEKKLLEGITINTVSDCEQLLQMAEAAGVTAEVMSDLVRVTNLMAEQKARGNNSPIAISKEDQEIINQLSNGTYKPQFELDYEFDYKGPKKQTDSSSSDKDTKETYDWIEVKIQNIEDEISQLDKIIDSSYTSFDEKLTASIGNYLDNMEKVSELSEYMKQQVKEATEKGIDLDKTVFGNIDTDNRQIINWTDELIEQYKSAFQSWESEAVDDWDSFKQDMIGSFSTVYASSGNYDGFDIAFSPILQTANGGVLLDSSTVDKYIFGIIDEAKAKYADDWGSHLIEIDAKGIDVDSKHIKGLIADIGETAIQTSEAMHYVGKTGSIETTKAELALVDKVKSKISLLQEEKELYDQAYAKYMEEANKIGLKQKYIDLIKNGEMDIETISDETLKEQIKKYQELYGKAKDCAEKSADIEKTSRDVVESAYELEIAHVQTNLERGTTTEYEAALEREIIWQRYYSQLSDWDDKLLEHQTDNLNEYKSVLTNVASAASSLLDDDINDLNKEKEKKDREYEKQIKPLEKMVKAIDKQIKPLNVQIKLYNKLKDAIQDELDALDKQNEDLKLQKDLQKALYEQQKAYSQRTQYVYKDGQFVYERDETAVRDANDQVADARFAIQKNELQKQIDAYDKLIEGLNLQIEALEDSKDALNDQIEALNEAKEAADEYYEEQIRNIEDLKNVWEELLKVEERAKNNILLKQYFGKEYESLIRSGDSSAISQWIADYASVMQQLSNETGGADGEFLSDTVKKFLDLSNAAGEANAKLTGNTWTDLGIGDLLNDSGNLTTTFQQMADAINKVAGVDGEGGLPSVEASADETLPNVQNGLDLVTDSATNATDQVGLLQGAIDSLQDKTVTITIETVGDINATTATNKTVQVGAVGSVQKTNAHYEGTAKLNGDWGVQSGGQSLVGEAGRELVVRGSRFFTVGDNGAEMVNLRPGDIVFNHLQTKQLLENGHINSRGNAYAGGTVNKLPDNLVPISGRNIEISSLLSSVNAINPILQKMNSNVDTITKNINYVNGTNKTQEVNQTFNITMPNITDSTSAITLMKDLQSLSMKKMQFFNS